jgi:hypothetical protein
MSYRHARQFDRPKEIGVHDTANRVRLEFFGCAQEAIRRITDDGVYSAEVLDGSLKGVANIR